jgi:hypothetical protein
MDAEGWVAISMLASFNRVKALSTDEDLIGKALHRSTELEVSGEHVRRRGDWFRWVLPTAKPSQVKRQSQGMTNGISAMSSQHESPAPSGDVKTEAVPVWEGGWLAVIK